MHSLLVMHAPTTHSHTSTTHGLLNDFALGTPKLTTFISFDNIVDLPIVEEDQSPGGSYESLRKIIQAVVQEVIRLPEFYNQKNAGTIDAVAKDSETLAPFDPKKYEDLLATAVINKVSCSPAGS